MSEQYENEMIPIEEAEALPYLEEPAALVSHEMPSGETQAPGGVVAGNSIRVPTRARLIYQGQQVAAVDLTQVPGYLQYALDPITGPPPPPPPPPPAPTLAGFTITPSVVAPGGTLTLSVQLSLNTTTGVVIPVAGPFGTADVFVAAGQGIGQKMIAVPIGQPAGPLAFTATYLGKVLPYTVTVTLPQPEPPPPPPPPGPYPVPGPSPTPIPDGPVWWVGPVSSGIRSGTQANPFGLDQFETTNLKALVGSGGIVYLKGGTYRKSPNPEGLGFRIVQGGTAGRPLIFRNAPGERVTIDGGWTWWGGGHAWLWGVELIVSEEMPHGTTGSDPPGAPRGGGHAYYGEGHKFIHCVAHHNRQGFSLWTPSREVEVYGCITYDNGWRGSDRDHGHQVYLQNPGPYRKTITDHIMAVRETVAPLWDGGRFSMHGYGQSAVVTNVVCDGVLQLGTRDPWLLGDGAGPIQSTGHVMANCLIHGARVQLASAAIQPALLQNTVIADGSLELIGGEGLRRENTLVAPPAAKPSSPTVLLRPSRYEANRAHLGVIDWQRAGTVTIYLGDWAQNGQPVSVYDPTALWGAPIAERTGPTFTLSVPNGAASFVLYKR